MKKWEKDKMVEIWREKAPKQALYIKKHLARFLDRLREYGNGRLTPMMGKPGFTSSLLPVDGSQQIEGIFTRISLLLVAKNVIYV